ncbi:MAG: sulfite exporter TauE/SafE family protein [Zoogloeaceae bacterium]|nr:sulfite exporter TauE/SafE family protein [Zoogloeaceae bacterium]
MTIWWLLYPLLGAVTGFFAGLLGIGGGAVMVPLLVVLFAAQGLGGDEIMHMALGTSMATILFTAIASVRAHHRHRAVEWRIVAAITPGILLGTLLGARLASQVSSTALAFLFVVFILYVAAQMIVGFNPRASRSMPGAWGTALAGVGIGAFSCLVAIGGGMLSVPFMLWCNVRAQHAIGTSAAIGFPIALGGTAGYMVNGWQNPALPPYSIGFVYLPAVAGMVVASMLTAPMGATLTHRLPVNRLRQIFAAVLLLLAFSMLRKLV